MKQNCGKVYLQKIQIQVLIFMAVSNYPLKRLAELEAMACLKKICFEENSDLESEQWSVDNQSKNLVT